MQKASWSSNQVSFFNSREYAGLQSTSRTPKKNRAVLRKESGSWPERIFQFWRHLAGTAGILVLGFSFAWAWIVHSGDKDRELIAEAISDHSRSLLADHLLDVTSSDQRTVEPRSKSRNRFRCLVPSKVQPLRLKHGPSNCQARHTFL
jgi:hypothetical protein